MALIDLHNNREQVKKKNSKESAAFCLVKEFAGHAIMNRKQYAFNEPKEINKKSFFPKRFASGKRLLISPN